VLVSRAFFSDPSFLRLLREDPEFLSKALFLCTNRFEQGSPRYFGSATLTKVRVVTLVLFSSEVYPGVGEVRVSWSFGCCLESRVLGFVSTTSTTGLLSRWIFPLALCLLLGCFTAPLPLIGLYHSLIDLSDHLAESMWPFWSKHHILLIGRGPPYDRGCESFFIAHVEFVVLIYANST